MSDSDSKRCTFFQVDVQDTMGLIEKKKKTNQQRARSYSYDNLDCE